MRFGFTGGGYETAFKQSVHVDSFGWDELIADGADLV